MAHRGKVVGGRVTPSLDPCFGKGSKDDRALARKQLCKFHHTTRFRYLASFTLLLRKSKSGKWSYDTKVEGRGTLPKTAQARVEGCGEGLRGLPTLELGESLPTGLLFPCQG